MTTTTLVIVAIVVAIAVLALAWMYAARRRRAHLRTRFGPEYQRTVADLGSAQKAEAVLEQREKRVASYHIRELTADERSRFTEAWRRLQAIPVLGLTVPEYPLSVTPDEETAT